MGEARGGVEYRRKEFSEKVVNYPNVSRFVIFGTFINLIMIIITYKREVR